MSSVRDMRGNIFYMSKLFIFGNRRKGQALVLEEMMMVVLGIILVAGIIFLFSNINERILEHVEEEQAEEVNGYIKSNIELLKSMDCTKCFVVINVPDNIGGKSYTVIGSKNRKNILIHNNDGLWNEKNLTVEFVGMSHGYDMLQLKYEGGIVYLKGVSNY